jgi:hypothetical protein
MPPGQGQPLLSRVEPATERPLLAYGLSEWLLKVTWPTTHDRWPEIIRHVGVVDGRLGTLLLDGSLGAQKGATVATTDRHDTRHREHHPT